MKICLSDCDEGGRSESLKRLHYALAIIRAVNGLVDATQNGLYADSVLSVAKRIGLPDWLVEIRHDATHNELPSLSVLRTAIQHLLLWFRDNYWIPQHTYLNSSSEEILRISTTRVPSDINHVSVETSHTLLTDSLVPIFLESLSNQKSPHVANLRSIVKQWPSLTHTLLYRMGLLTLRSIQEDKPAAMENLTNIYICIDYLTQRYVAQSLADIQFLKDIVAQISRFLHPISSTIEFGSAEKVEDSSAQGQLNVTEKHILSDISNKLRQVYQWQDSVIKPTVQSSQSLAQSPSVPLSVHFSLHISTRKRTSSASVVCPPLCSDSLAKKESVYAFTKKRIMRELSFLAASEGQMSHRWPSSWRSLDANDVSISPLGFLPGSVESPALYYVDDCDAEI